MRSAWTNAASPDAWQDCISHTVCPRSGHKLTCANHTEDGLKVFDSVAGSGVEVTKGTKVKARHLGPCL